MNQTFMKEQLPLPKWHLAAYRGREKHTTRVILSHCDPAACAPFCISQPCNTATLRACVIRQPNWTTVLTFRPRSRPRFASFCHLDLCLQPVYFTGQWPLCKSLDRIYQRLRTGVWSTAITNHQAFMSRRRLVVYLPTRLYRRNSRVLFHMQSIWHHIWCAAWFAIWRVCN
jgi:hypothetical protein